MGSRAKLPDPNIPIRHIWIQKNYPDGSLGDKAIVDYPYQRIIHYTHVPPLIIIINPTSDE